MIANGTRLGPYEVTAPLGAGGMGEVYRARDSRLERTVAIKVLPARLSSDPRLRERFEREAKAISSLTHPNICTLYDVGSHAGLDYLVMEYLEGESLADRLERGPLPYEHVLRYGAEIAEALDKAHRAGIVHRDLKPGNVILTKGGAKLLDFGLAKLAQPGSLVNSDPNAATAMMAPPKPLTEEGSILGTFQYMAPEQIEGREADARTDIFALGAVLYEMATGKRAFEAKSKASLIASILDREPPPISTAATVAPASFERVVRMCLAKEPDDRWQSAHDVAAELRWLRDASSESIGPGARNHRRRGWIGTAAVAAVALIAGAAAAWLAKDDPAGEAAVVRTTIRTPPNAPLLLQLGAIAISPDGRNLVYRAEVNGRPQFFLRPLDRPNATPIAGTEGARSPVFSPDGRWIAFFADEAIYKVPRDGGTRQKLTPSPGGGLGLTWAGDTLYATRSFAGGLWAIPANLTDKPRQIVKTEGKDQRAVVWPDVLPDGKTVIATVWSTGAWDEARIVAFSVADGSSKVLIQGGYFARYAPTGHLLFMRGGNLMAVTFDAETLETGTNAVTVVNGVAHGTSDGEAQYAVTAAGHIAYVSGGDSVPLGRLRWIDSRGISTPIVPTARRYGSIALSRDQSSAVVTIEGSTYDVWSLDLERDALTRISHGGDDADAILTPDGDRVIWSSSRTGTYNLYWRATDGSTPEQPLAPSSNYQERPTVTPDGRAVVYTQFGSKYDLWRLPLDTLKPETLIATEFSESGAAVSPDGRWLAYASDESGKPEVYITSYPVPKGKWQVSIGGGFAPQWKPDARELVYYYEDKLFVVSIESTLRVKVGKPRMLIAGNFDDEFSIGADGRVAVIENEARKTSSELNLVLNATQELSRRLPSR